jgi:hypothetical protein
MACRAASILVYNLLGSASLNAARYRTCQSAILPLDQSQDEGGRQIVTPGQLVATSIFEMACTYERIDSQTLLPRKVACGINLFALQFNIREKVAVFHYNQWAISTYRGDNGKFAKCTPAA